MKVAFEDAWAVEESEAEPATAGTLRLFIPDTAGVTVAATTKELVTLVVVVVPCEYAGAVSVCTLEENGARTG